MGSPDSSAPVSQTPNQAVAELFSLLEALGGNSVLVLIGLTSAFLLADSRGPFPALRGYLIAGWWPSSSIFAVRNGKAHSSHDSALSCIFYCPVSLPASRKDALLLRSQVI